MFVDLREEGNGKERESKRNTDVREKHRSVSPCTYPNWGLNLQPRYVPRLGIEPSPGRGKDAFFLRHVMVHYKYTVPGTNLKRCRWWVVECAPRVNIAPGFVF